MKTKLSKIIIAAASLFVLLNTLHSQTGGLNIEAGKYYKFVLFDDTEFIGKVLTLDSEYVKVKTKYKGTVTLQLDNILIVSNDLTPEKYMNSFSVMGGVSFLNNGDHYYSRNSESGPHVDLNAMFYISSTKAFKIDASYSIANPKYDDGYYYYATSGYPETYTGGKSTFFSIKPSIVLGTLKPSEKIMAFGSLGFGLNYYKREDIVHTYSYANYNDTLYTTHTDINKGFSKVSAIISIGGGLGYRITNNLSVISEAEINILTVSNNFTSYIPVRLGISYMLY